MKRVLVLMQVEVEGPTASGDNLRSWLLDKVPDEIYREDNFRVIRADVLGEDRGAPKR